MKNKHKVALMVGVISATAVIIAAIISSCSGGGNTIHIENNPQNNNSNEIIVSEQAKNSDSDIPAIATVTTTATTSPPQTTPTEPTTKAIVKTNLSDLTNISGRKLYYSDTFVNDNYEKKYNDSFRKSGNSGSFHVLLNEKYEKFNVTFFVLNGQTSDKATTLTIVLDDVEIAKETLNKTDKPIEIEVDVTGGNDFTLYLEGGIDARISNAYFS